ncbi:hypothetical protein ECPA23_1824, partial [Escherichia coli PA23]
VKIGSWRVTRRVINQTPATTISPPQNAYSWM